MQINPFLKNPWPAIKARWSKQLGNSQSALFTTPAYDPYSNQNYSVDNNFPEKAWNAAGTDILETYRRDADDQLRIGAEGIAPTMTTINFPLATNASIVTQRFFVAPIAMKIRAISCTFATANGATLTGYVSKESGTAAPGSGQQVMVGTFNLNATANTGQSATLATINPTSSTANGSSNPAYIYLAAGDSLSLKLSTTVTSLAGLVISIAAAPGGKGTIAVYNMQANGDLVDQHFFLANRDFIVTAAYYIHTTKCSVATQYLMLKKCTGTQAAASGTAMLTNNSNSGFDTSAANNTLQTGTLSATAATLRLAPGNRLSLDFATVTALAGVCVVVLLQPVLYRKEVTFTLQKNANLVTQSFFVADRNYKIEVASAVWATLSSGAANVQLTRDTGTDAPGAGTILLSNDTSAGFQIDGTAETPEVATWIDTRFNYLMAGDRMALKFPSAATGLLGLTVTVSLTPA